MAIVLVLAGTVGLSAAPAGATTVPRAIPVYSPDSSRSRYIVVAHDGASYESLRTDLIDADALVLEEYRDVIDGASVLLTLEQVEALESDARVLAVDADEIFETSASEPNDSDVIPGRYIIELAPRASVTAQEEILSILGDGITHQYTEAFRGFAAELTDPELKVLREHPSVRLVEPDRFVRVNNQQTSPPWGLDRIDQANLPLDSRFSYQGSGVGVTAYIVDSGVFASHSDFGGRVRLGYGVDGAGDCDGHGTHVAGTVGGQTYGVAKGVSLVSVRVLGCNGSGSVSDIIAGLNWIITDHAAGVRAVANMSIGGSFSSILNTTVESVFNDGVVVVAAAGNETANACNKSPASTPNALTVAASNSADRRASFSNYGPCVDLFAPGVSVLSASMSGGSWYADGTSMAAPHVAGAAAVMWGLNPSYTASQVTSQIIATATPGKITDTANSPNRLLYLAPASGVAPGAPSNVVATSVSGTATISWSAPVNSGSNAITSYSVVANTGTVVCTWSTGPLQCQTSVLSPGTYQFRVSASSSAGASSFSAFSNSVTLSVTGNNDFFSAARVLSGASGSISDSNSVATRETNEPITFGSTGSTKWYSFTPASSGRLAINTVGSSFDTVLGVFTGSSVSGLSMVARDDDSGESRTSSLSVSVSSGITYFIQVGSYFSSSSGAITLTWSLTTVNCVSTPSNDNFACALNLASSSSSVTGSNAFATLEPSEPYTYGVCRSVWYRFTPSVAGNVTLSTAGSSFDTLIDLFRASSSSPTMGALSLVARNDDDGGGQTSRISDQAIESGYTYFVRITGWSSSSCSSGNFTLSWTIGSNVVVPSAPTSVVATGGNASATVSWTAPASNGGAAITSYTATASPSGRSCTATTGVSCVISGLTNGVSYTFTVSARNSVGSGPSSSPSAAVFVGYTNDNIANALGLTQGTTFSNNTSATRETNEPNHASVSGGKSMWFRYSTPVAREVLLNTRGSNFDTVVGVYSLSGSVSQSGNQQGEAPEGATLSLTAPEGTVFTGVTFASYGTPNLVNGNYSLGSCHAETSAAVIANIFVGRNSASVSASNTMFGDPCPGQFKRLHMRLTYGPASSVSFGALQSVVSNDDESSGVNGSSAVSFVAQPNVLYYIAIDGYRGSSGSITINFSESALVTPGAPTRVAAAPRNGGATISWLPPVSNALSVTSYLATSSPGGRTCQTTGTGTSCDITGLANGVTYVFSVVARNVAGSSPSSALSNSVVPSVDAPTRTVTHSWGIDRIDSRGPATNGLLDMPGRGQGVRIYIVDTGIRATHSDFGGRVVAGYSVVPDGYGTNDCNGHGTHVASTAAGVSYGVASAATLIPVRVLDCEGSGMQSDTIDGLNWIAGNVRSVGGPAVVNMSLGGGYNLATNLAVRSLIAMGVPVVAAAGNDARSACNVSPASEPLAITVAAITESDTQSGFSNRGSCVDIFAPGVDITAAGIGSDTSRSTKDGTSMAAPHVAGYAAVVRGLFPTASATAITAAVLNTSTPWAVRNISLFTPNRLLYVAASKCEVAAAMSVPCTTATSTQSIAKRVSRNAPVSRTKMAKMAKIKVPRGATISISVPKSRDRAFCRIKNNKVVAVRKGSCSVSVTVRAKGKRPITKSVRLKVVM
jgi:subtilisin family serine protease